MYFQLFLYNSRRPDIIFGHLRSENNFNISRESDWVRRVHVTDQSIIINVTYGQPGTKLTTITNRLSSISMPNEMRIKGTYKNYALLHKLQFYPYLIFW